MSFFFFCAASFAATLSQFVFFQRSAQWNVITGVTPYHHLPTSVLCLPPFFVLFSVVVFFIVSGVALLDVAFFFFFSANSVSLHFV